MPKKLPGITLEFAIVSDDGDVQSGTVRAPKAALPIKAMKAIRKAVANLGSEEAAAEEQASDG